MKSFIVIILLFLLLFASCEEEIEKENVLLEKSSKPSELLDYSVIDNSILSLSFSEIVELEEIVIDGKKKNEKILDKDFSIPLDKTLSLGERITVALTVANNRGDLTRIFITLYGKNENKATLLLNEISIKGTKTSPDRIELLVTKGGNTSGLRLTDDLSQKGIILPPIEVSRGDILVVYWDSETKKETIERDNGKKTYYLSGNMDHTLISTTGAIILFEDEGENVMDGILYSDFSSSEYGKERYDKCLELLSLSYEWSGDAVSSEFVTSSRVLTRLQGGIDTNSADDWFTCAARKSSFGEENSYYPYQE